MGKKTTTNQEPKNSRPFITPEGAETYLISLAHNLVEQRLRDGTASSQEVTHFLKLGSRKEALEREKLEEENKLLRAKTENLQSQKQVDKMYAEAIAAMRRYSGNGEPYEEY